MNHILLVHVLYAFNDLFEDDLDLVFVLHPGAVHFSYVLVQVIPVDVLDYDGDFVAGVDSIMKLHDTWMV